jgi:hypothetical protein
MICSGIKRTWDVLITAQIAIPTCSLKTTASSDLFVMIASFPVLASALRSGIQNQGA